MDKIKTMRLQYQADTMPDYALSVLWTQVWEEARRELHVDLHSLLPEARLHEIDTKTVEILNCLGVTVSRLYGPESRQFSVKGFRVYWSTQKTEWAQDTTR